MEKKQFFRCKPLEHCYKNLQFLPSLILDTYFIDVVNFDDVIFTI